MSFVNQGAQPVTPPPFLSQNRRRKFSAQISSSCPGRLLFLIFLILFYCIELLWIGPVDGINDDWGMYSTLSGAYLGYPDAHVLFFLYPLSWLLSRLYLLCSFIPWYGLFMHSVQIACLYAVYRRSLQLWQRHSSPDAFWKPALAIACILFLVVDVNVLSEAQYTTTAGLAAATAIFCFTTTRSNGRISAFLKSNVPTFLFAWTAFSMRQNILYLMLPMAGMLWLAKAVHANQNGYTQIPGKFLGFAGILLLGMALLYGADAAAYSEQQWTDFKKINHYRERVGDFYTWPEYEECADKLTSLGIDEEEYNYRRNGAPYIGYGMSVEDWKQMHNIAKECYLARTGIRERLKNVVIGSVTVFLYEDGMQPANFLVALLAVITFLLILLQKNRSALFVFLSYLIGRFVSWGYVLYEGRFPKRIIQPLITVDYAVLFGILLAFNLLRLEKSRRYSLILPIIATLSLGSLIITKNNVDGNYHTHQETWEQLKDYCHSHPDNLYIWTYNSGTLEYYCESPFDLNLDAYNNFVYTNWGVILNPNTRTKLARHGISDFDQTLVDNDHVYFILQDAPHNEEHPVILYFRHTYGASCETVDTFTAGDTVYLVYQLRQEARNTASFSLTSSVPVITLPS